MPNTERTANIRNIRFTLARNSGNIAGVTTVDPMMTANTTRTSPMLIIIPSDRIIATIADALP